MFQRNSPRLEPCETPHAIFIVTGTPWSSSHKYRNVPPRYEHRIRRIYRLIHALEGLVNHLPWNEFEGVPDIETDDHSIAASVMYVHKMSVKRTQHLISTPILPKTELPVGQSDPRINHEPLHLVHQQHLQYLFDVVQETQRPVRRG